METQARSSEVEPIADESPKPTYPPPGKRGPTTAAGARFLEELRARRQLDHLYGTRTINPDETPEERTERIAWQREGLRRLIEASGQMSDDDHRQWQEIMDSVAASHRDHPNWSDGDCGCEP